MSRGKVVLKLGDDISTDIIYPGRFMATVLPSETPQYAFADHADFQQAVMEQRIPAGGYIVAGDNFGCGSSREQAASCIKGHDLTVIAHNFARIFLQNSINVGLRMLICPGIEAGEGDELEIGDGEVRNLTTGKSFPVEALPKSRQAIIDAGGLIPFVRELLLERSGESAA
jgi:3-isopropylmalate/(R)-2-methylmalate dehydratase small subunit